MVADYYLPPMPSVNPDIKAIADRDPVMRELLGHQAYFLYKDWQLFRDRKPAELARRLERRMQRGFVMFCVLGAASVLLGVPAILFDSPGADSFYVSNVLRVVLYGGLSVWMARHFFLARRSFREMAERFEAQA